MTRTIVQRQVQAPPGVVFRAFAHPASLPEVVPNILRVEFLSEQTEGRSTRFKEVRAMGKREEITELEITEYEPEQRVRMVADSHGTVWDTTFVVQPHEGGCALELTMDARAHKLLPRLLNPIMKGLIRRGVEDHVDAVVQYCERQ